MFYIFNFYNFPPITNFAVTVVPQPATAALPVPLLNNRIMLICNPQIYNFYEIFHLFIIQWFSFQRLASTGKCQQRSGGTPKSTVNPT